MQLFYTPQHARVGDVIPYYEDGKFHLFYLKNWNPYFGSDRKDGWHLLNTKDMVHYGPETAIGILGGTGSVIKADGIYHLYYCVFEQNPQRQYVCHATSSDLDSWTKHEEETFGPDETIYLPTDWRDPYVFWNEEENCWWMIFAAQKKGKTTRRGCVGLCKSKDLHHWDYCEPFYAPMNAQCAFECPDFFRMGDWYYLVFSSYADRYQTMYRKSRSPYGPWQTPEIDTFDTRAFYAAKTGSDGVHRYVYGWNPTREVNEHNFDPPGYPGKDCNTWDWGGSLVVHELWQDENGDLFVKPIPQVLEAVGWEEPLQMQALTGEWKLEKNQAEVDAPYDFGALLLNPVGETSRLSFDVEVDGDCPSVGIAVHVEETFTVGYYLLIDFGRRRIEFKSGVRMTERGGQMFPYEVELERPLPSSTGRSFHVDVIADGTILEAYVDGKIALGTRMYDQTGGCFGLYASDGKAVFRDIKVFHA